MIARGGLKYFKRAPAPVVAAVAPALPPPPSPAAAVPETRLEEPILPEDIAALKKDALAALERGKVDDAKGFLDRLLRKAGLTGDSWPADARIWRYTTDEWSDR